VNLFGGGSSGQGKTAVGLYTKAQKGSSKRGIMNELESKTIGPPWNGKEKKRKPSIYGRKKTGRGGKRET